MEIDFYIFNWPRAVHARQLENYLAGLERVTVINSGACTCACTCASWVELDSEAYFAAQWNEALRRFKGDMLFHIQADACCAYMKEIVARALELREKFDWGLFAPNIDFTHHAERGSQLEPAVWEVPCTDCTCWAISRAVIAAGPAWFPGKFGWGIDLSYGRRPTS